MFWFRNKDRQLLREILRRIECIERRLEPKVVVTLHIGPSSKWSYRYLYSEPSDGPEIQSIDYYRGEWQMASIQAGNSGTFVVSGTASDNSDVTLSNIQLTADDSSVVIAADPSDTTGATFTVSVPASDTGTVVNLTANASASTSTSPSPTVVPATLAVTIQPGQASVTVTLAINQK